MLKTFALFAAQLLVTYAIFHYLGESEKFTEWMKKNIFMYVLVALILPLILILVMIFVPMPMPVKIVLFTLFSACFGIGLAYLKRKVPPEVIRAALIGSVAIFVALFFVGIVLTLLGVNLWWLGGILFVALLGIIITSVVFLFIDESKKAVRIKAGIALLVFALFVMYDTNQILQRDYWGDFVTAALDYYLDILNIFVQLIQLLGDN
jgi:FtsH-binding integral membrane protein